MTLYYIFGPPAFLGFLIAASNFFGGVLATIFLNILYASTLYYFYLKIRSNILTISRQIAPSRSKGLIFYLTAITYIVLFPTFTPVKLFLKNPQTEISFILIALNWFLFIDGLVVLVLIFLKIYKQTVPQQSKANDNNV